MSRLDRDRQTLEGGKLRQKLAPPHSESIYQLEQYAWRTLWNMPVTLLNTTV